MVGLPCLGCFPSRRDVEVPREITCFTVRFKNCFGGMRLIISNYVDHFFIQVTADLTVKDEIHPMN